MDRLRPIMDEGLAAVDRLCQNDLYEQMGYSKLPKPDGNCVKAVAILLKDPIVDSWDDRSHKRFVQTRRTFLTDVKQAHRDDFESLEEADFAALESIVSDGDFRPEVMDLKITQELCVWVKNLLTWSKAMRVLSPKRQVYEEKQQELSRKGSQ